MFGLVILVKDLQILHSTVIHQFTIYTSLWPVFARECPFVSAWIDSFGVVWTEGISSQGRRKLAVSSGRSWSELGPGGLARQRSGRSSARCRAAVADLVPVVSALRLGRLVRAEGSGRSRHDRRPGAAGFWADPRGGKSFKRRYRSPFLKLLTYFIGALQRLLDRPDLISTRLRISHLFVALIKQERCVRECNWTVP